MTAWVRPGTPAERARRCGEWSASEFESFASAPAAYPKTRYKPCWRRVRRAGRAVVGGGAAAPPGTLRTLGGYLRNIVINKLPPAFRIDTHPMRSVPLRRTRPPDPPGRRGCRARSARLVRRTRGGRRGARVIDPGTGRPVPC